MAGRKDLEATYSTIDFIFRRSIGETGDYSGALFDGDFSLSLADAQLHKHQFVIESLRLGAEGRFIDLGCGWGGLLRHAESQGLHGVGLTLSERQARSCRHHGLEAHVEDCRSISPDQFGTFDAASSLGAFEHFCSPEDARAGRQEELYAEFFRSVASLLPPGGRFFLQTMVFGPNVPPGTEFSLDAPRDSDEYALALMAWGNPGSWLPSSIEQVLESAAPHFDTVGTCNGRVDYIETLKRWSNRFRRFDLPKYLLYGLMLPRLAMRGTLRLYLDALRLDPNGVCFERLLMDHHRIVFEKPA